MRQKELRQNGVTRRKFFKIVGSAGMAVAGASFLPRISRAAARDHILIGHPAPSTGPIAPFGETSAWADERAMAEINPTSAAGGTMLIVLWTTSSKNPLFSIGGFWIRQNSD